MRGLTLIAIIGLILIVLLMVNVISITNNQIVLSFPDISYFVEFLNSWNFTLIVILFMPFLFLYIALHNPKSSGKRRK
jgi:uncharacterized BrkB/YihY/UPF0761 family membrane protein